MPTDADMPLYIPMQEVSYSEEENSYVFEEESAKELAMEQGENGRRTGALVDFQKKLKEALIELKNKILGKKYSEKRRRYT